MGLLPPLYVTVVTTCHNCYDMSQLLQHATVVTTCHSYMSQLLQHVTVVTTCHSCYNMLQLLQRVFCAEICHNYLMTMDGHVSQKVAPAPYTIYNDDGNHSVFESS